MGGCFSCCTPRDHDGKKNSTEMKRPEKLESQPAVVPPKTFQVAQAGNSMKPKPNEIQKLPQNSQSAVPTKKDYAIATVKEVLTLTQSAASVIPVPFLNEAIGAALKIIQVCEESSDVEQKLKELQVKVGDVMIVIVDNVTLNEEGTKETVTTKGLEQDVKELLRILRSINEDLAKIGSQNRWAKAAYKQTNTNAIDGCMNRLTTAMQKFTFSNDLRDSARINEVHTRLLKMANKVDDIHYKVDDIHTILFKLKRSGTQPASETLARQEIPLKPEIFHGRDDMVEGITKLLLQEKTSRVCILGAGGMGKTSVSLAVVESPLMKKRFPGGNVVWVPCVEATSATLFLDILYIQLQVPGDKQVTLEKIISELDTPKQPRLIVFDNFETPWNGNQKQVGDILRRLAMLNHVAILVTMRGRQPPCHNAIKWQSKDIKSTDEAASLRIYHDINPDSKNDPGVPKLLSVLGYMPFAVTLMAKLGVESQSSAKDLLDAWSESGPDILSNDLEQSMNRSIQLSVESDLVKRNPNANLLLSILSLLPAGTTKENLHWWAPALKMSMVPSAIATLSQAALLGENKRENSDSPVLSVVPVVQSFMQQQNRITQEVRKQVHLLCYEYVLTHACRVDDSTFRDKSKALAAEDTNIQSILFGSPPSQRTTVPSNRNMEAVIAFNWYRCDTTPNLEIADHAVMVAKASGAQRFIASAVWCLGRTHSQIGNLDTAHRHMQEAYQLFNTLPLGDVESQRLGGLCGIDLVDNARHTLPADELVSLAQEVEKKCSALSDDLIHGRSLLGLGKALYEAQQYQKALYYMDRARTVFKAVGNNLNLARAYLSISWIHHHEHRLPDALGAIEEAWKYAELTDSRYIRSVISLDLGRTLFNTDQDTKAWKYIEIALMNASNIGMRFQVARALEYMAYGYIRKGDYKNANGAYEAAAEKYSGTVFTASAKRCTDNMSWIKRKQGHPDEVVGFYRPDIDSDKTLFYPTR